MTNTPVDSPFVRRLAAAARAGWWTLLIGAVIVTVQFTVYSMSIQSRDFWPWMSNMLGLDPETARLLLVRFMLAIRFLLVLLLMVNIFLSLWVRRLRRVGDA
jgi:hypothetical protein